MTSYISQQHTAYMLPLAFSNSSTANIIDRDDVPTWPQCPHIPCSSMMRAITAEDCKLYQLYFLLETSLYLETPIQLQVTSKKIKLNTQTPTICLNFSVQLFSKIFCMSADLYFRTFLSAYLKISQKLDIKN